MCSHSSTSLDHVYKKKVYLLLYLHNKSEELPLAENIHLGGGHELWEEIQKGVEELVKKELEKLGDDKAPRSDKMQY